MTSSVIEVIGPAGIGKSTLVRSLIRKEHVGQTCQLLSVSQFLSVPRIQSPRFVSSLLANYALHGNNPEPSKLLFRRQPVTTSFLAGATEEWTNFISVCIDVVSKDRRAAEHRLLALSFLYNTVASRIAIDTIANNEQFILMDEPVGYRPSLFQPFEDVPSESMRKYYESLPLPAAIIHLSASVNTVTDRVIKRSKIGRVAHRHNGMSFSEIKQDTEWASCLADFCVMMMKERGVQVLEISGECDISLNVDKSLEFIHNSLQASR